MKYGFVMLLLACSFFAGAQSLKEALYGGKLKNQPGTVIRKTDDLSTKIDTTTRVATADSAKTKVAATNTTANVSKPAVAKDSVVRVALQDTASIETIAGVEEVIPEEEKAVVVEEKPKDNNALWKDYMNSIQPVLTAEVLPNKKVKKGTYSVMVSYTIDTDGQTSVADVFVAPENDYIRDQVKNRLTDSPKLIPVLNSAGTARKVTKRYSFTLTKN